MGEFLTHRAAGCSPLWTANQLYPGLLRGKLRTLMGTSCNMTHSTHSFQYLSGAGDTWTSLAGYNQYSCLKQHAWLDAFYTALQGRINKDEWYVIDVGGNMGQEPIIAGLNGLVSYTFEPFPSNVKTLKYNAALNCVHDMVHVRQYGTSHQPGISCFKPSNANRRYETLSNAGQQVKAGGQGGTCLNLTSLDAELDHTFDKQRKPLLLKADCEGNEFDTFMGAAKLLETAPPLVITFEVGDEKLLSRIVPLLEQRGYGLYSQWAADSHCDKAPLCKTPLVGGSYFEALPTQKFMEVIAIHLKSSHDRTWRGLFDDSRMAMLHERARAKERGG